MALEPVDWNEACTLEEALIKYFEARTTRSDEFKALLKIYNRADSERGNELYKKWRADHAHKKETV